MYMSRFLFVLGKFCLRGYLNQFLGCAYTQWLSATRYGSYAVLYKEILVLCCEDLLILRETSCFHNGVAEDSVCDCVYD
jgi:hypothetical protein